VAGIAGSAEKRAEDRPLRVVAPARKREAAGEPPGTGRAAARGANDDAATAVGSSPHTSSCASSGYCAMIHWCSAKTA